jgi:hypothetical protein
MDYSKIILLGKNINDGFVFAKLDKENCNFEYINTTSRTITIGTLIKDILKLDKQVLNDILFKMSESGIKEILEEVDSGVKILSKVYPNFIAYTEIKDDDSFNLYEKTDKKIIFKEYFDKERFDKLLKTKDSSVFEIILRYNDLFDEVLNYEAYADEITSAEEPEPTENLENLKQDFLKEFEKLLQKYYNLDLTKFE